jgi:hypothetical protein
LKTNRPDVGAAEKCIRFGIEILKASRENKGLGNDRRCIVEYLVETLLSPSEHKDDAEASVRAVFEMTASAEVVEVCAFDPERESASLVCRGEELLDVGAVGQERAFLLNIAAIVECACRAGMYAASQGVSEFLRIGMEKVEESDASDKELSGALYIHGRTLYYLDSDPTRVSSASTREMQLPLLCFQKMTNLLVSKVEQASHFASDPRGEVAQNEQVVLVRSVMDAISLSVTLTSVTYVAYTANEWCQLKVETLGSLRRVVEWNLKAVHLLSPKLVALEGVVIESVGRAVSGLPGGVSPDLSTGL